MCRNGVEMIGKVLERTLCRECREKVGRGKKGKGKNKRWEGAGIEPKSYSRAV